MLKLEFTSKLLSMKVSIAEIIIKVPLPEEEILITQFLGKGNGIGKSEDGGSITCYSYLLIFAYTFGSTMRGALEWSS